MANVDLTSMNDYLRDVYAAPGTRLKQYVVDMQREAAWERETCPKFSVPEHDDNTGLSCRNSNYPVPWTHLAHDCCHDCCQWYEDFSARPEVVAWLAEKGRRPRIEKDRSKLSDEVQEDQAMSEHPLLRARR